MAYFDLNRVPDHVTLQMNDGWLTLHKHDDITWQSNGIELLLSPISSTQQNIVLSSSQPVQHIKLRWQQRIDASLRYLGDHWERGYGDLEWRGMVPERVMPWYFLTFDGTHTHGYGVKTGAHAICFWQIDTQGITLWLDIRSGNAGVELGQRSLPAASIICRRGIGDETPFQAAQAFCKQLCDHPVLPTQPIYGGNNWYYAYGNSSHREILDDAKLITDLAPSNENRPYMVIDDGWQICHVASCNGGPWHEGNYHFPDMHSLAQEMKALGTRPGIWFRPLLTMARMPDKWIFANRLHDSASNGLVLDPSLPEVRAYIQEDIRRMVDWGFELIKHDFSTYDIFGRWGYNMGASLTSSGWKFADCTHTTAEIILQLYQEIADAAAGKALILGCNTIGHLAAEIFALQRTGDDTSGRDWERTRKYGVNTLAFRMPQHGTFFAVDADCVGLTRHIPWELNRQWLQLLAHSGTPLFVSASPDAVGKEQAEALREAFAIAAQPMPVAEPLDWLETTAPGKWQIRGEAVEFDWYDAQGVDVFV